MPNEMLHRIVEQLSLADLATWRMVSASNCRIVADILNTDINHNLSRFVQHPSGVRDVMRDARAVISGSFALKIIDRQSTFTPNDVNFYVGKSGHGAIVKYLIEEEGYVTTETIDVDLAVGCGLYNFCGSIASVTKLQARGKNIDVICSTDESPTTPLPYFWTTLVMNFITADSICSAYPAITIRGRGLMHQKRLLDPSLPEGSRILCLEKYQERGYQFRVAPLHGWDVRRDGATRTCAQSWQCPCRNCFFGDAGCLMLNVACRDKAVSIGHQGHLNSPSTPPYGLTNMWRLGGARCGYGCNGEEEPEVETTMVIVTSVAHHVHFVE
ncbi:hypothetical protein B0H21DRAFT_695290 [Amylocystis lapponica]|nr:hypothetical protein B0H21DRAFT_695290 [Amylocystis lapponica]